jgi:Bifunctional DNA primase/polymerase, N-terminal
MPAHQVKPASHATPRQQLSLHGLMALRYAAMIGPVVPDFEILPSGTCACYGHRKHCKPGKHPRPRKGVNAATRDVFKIADWWLRNPRANVAICPDGFFVLEADASRGGLGSLERLEQAFGPFPVGPRSQSGGGGFHIYLRDVPDTHFVIDPGEWPGLEIKAKGSKVTEYPSNHVSGGAYRWLDGHEHDLPLPEPPAAFVKAFGRSVASPSRPHTNNRVLTDQSMKS